MQGAGSFGGAEDRLNTERLGGADSARC